VGSNPTLSAIVVSQDIRITVNPQFVLGLLGGGPGGRPVG
jgi:hypothetical protein